MTLAEGVRLVEEVIASNSPIQGVLVSPVLATTTRGRNLLELLEKQVVPVETVTEAELDALADTDHPQGIVAVVRSPSWTLENLVILPHGVALVLDGVQDPGNVGTMLRTALGLGAAGIVALPGTAELGNPKVVRGSMGAFFRLPSVRLGVEDLLSWTDIHNVSVLVATMDGTPVWQRRTQGPCAIVVGNEGSGVGAKLMDRGEKVAIPLAPGAESLNVAVAAGILLYEVMRDR
jgi:TrmH family RNA methyltransferase